MAKKKMTEHIVGTWFPSGYYGHFRSKSRNDFCCEYRNLARPQPPNKFLNRSKDYPIKLFEDNKVLFTNLSPVVPVQQPTPRHVFSHHDNRESFLNDALYFEQGLGRKRVPNETYNFKRDFITWMPEKEYIERSRPLVSTYKIDFNKSLRTEITQCSSTTTVEQREHHNVPQIMVKRPKTSFDGIPTTSYRYSHGDERSNPNREVINAMNNEALQLSLLNRKNRAMSAKSTGRESVASCLIWHNSETEKLSKVSNGKSRLPAATATTTFMPHPPPPRENGLPLKQVTIMSPPPGGMEQLSAFMSDSAPQRSPPLIESQILSAPANVPQPAIVWIPPQTTEVMG